MSETSKVKGGRLGWVYFLVGFVGMLVVGWVVFPMALYSKQTQPVEFSHKAHVENAGLECESCHGFREDGTFWGVPNLTTGNPDGQCLLCHEDPESPQGDDPREAYFLKEYVAKGVKAIEWKVYSKQQPCVFFPHSVHVMKAELECRVCHGDVEKSDTPPVYEANRLTGISRDIWGRNISGLTSNTWDSMKMGDCAACHTELGASNACFVCHK